MADDDRMRTLLGILSGDARTIHQHSFQANWVDRLCAKVIHSNQLLTIHEFGAVVNEYVGRVHLFL